MVASYFLFSRHSNLLTWKRCHSCLLVITVLLSGVYSPVEPQLKKHLLKNIFLTLLRQWQPTAVNRHSAGFHGTHPDYCKCKQNNLFCQVIKQHLKHLWTDDIQIKRNGLCVATVCAAVSGNTVTFPVKYCTRLICILFSSVPLSLNCIDLQCLSDRADCTFNWYTGHFA